ncbi:hypothetical protein OPV22_030923 [Ensete ventricosum]|uniref:Transcription factor CBF/NF-Y/archaeal histone domain-containing protein n=1 Tax=Ensete ventricosum TaxID=4639 RepID=A0AAV8PK51_ENSVE|nr:hypothetical protein OPV22_030923 [Ensete ventricosum]
MDIVGKSKEDVSLPKSTMFKIIKEMLPPDVRVARDTQDLLVECCVEFINLVSSESNEVCNREDKKTIAPEHVLKALEVLGFGEYIEEVYAAYEQHKLETLDSPKGGKFGGIEMTEEEALAEQQRMFAEARARMNNGQHSLHKSQICPQKSRTKARNPRSFLFIWQNEERLWMHDQVCLQQHDQKKPDHRALIEEAGMQPPPCVLD